MLTDGFFASLTRFELLLYGTLFQVLCLAKRPVIGASKPIKTEEETIANMDGLIMDHSHIRQVKEIEIGHLNLRYAHTRMHRAEIISRLVESIERSGQIIPVITVKQSESSFVLIDGYLRVAALRRCGKDMVMAEIWQCQEVETLIWVLMGSQERRWETLEQALMIRELRVRHNLSQAEIAHLMGRDQSWVSRRLCLLDALPEKVVELVQKGHVSAWAASRVLVPMARAIADHATILSQHLAKEHISTRDLTALFSHYQKANRNTRDRMVAQPALFLKVLRATEEDQAARSLKDGPEGRWLKDLRVAGHILGRLIKEVPTVIYKGQNRLEQRTLITAFEDTKKLFLALEQDIRRFHDDDNCRNQTDHPEPAPSGDQDSTNQSVAQHLQEHCARSPAGREERSAP